MACFDLYNHVSFKTVDKSNSEFDLQMKEALRINKKKPNLNTAH